MTIITAITISLVLCILAGILLELFGLKLTRDKWVLRGILTRNKGNETEEYFALNTAKDKPKTLPLVSRAKYSSSKNLCPCGSGKKYEDCCGR